MEQVEFICVSLFFPSKLTLRRKITPATKNAFKLIKLKPDLDINNDLSLVPYDRDGGARSAIFSRHTTPNSNKKYKKLKLIIKVAFPSFKI